MALVLALLTTTLAAADAARAGKTLEERLVPLTPAEVLSARPATTSRSGVLLQAGVRPDAAEPGGFRAGWTALHHAASRRDGKELTLLLKAGAPGNAQAKNGMTALCVAVGEGYPSNVADLLAARADATLVCRDGRTALHEATARAGEPRPSIVTVLLKAGRGSTRSTPRGRPRSCWPPAGPRGWRTSRCSSRAARSSTSRPQRPDRASRGRRPRSPPTAEALLRAGAAPSPKDGDGDTPLHLAARQDAVEILAILLKYGADTKAKNRLGETPLDTAHKSYRARAEDALRAASAAAPAVPARSGAPTPKP